LIGVKYSGRQQNDNMKQQKIFTLAILIATFALLWENEKVISAAATEVIESQHAGNWLRSNFTEVKCKGAEMLTVGLPEKINGMTQVIATRHQ